MDGKKIFESAYYRCWGEEALQYSWPMTREYSEKKFEEEMNEAYRNPNLALKKLYLEKDYYLKRINEVSHHRKPFEEGQLNEVKRKEVEASHVFVETAYRNGIEIEPELLDRFFASRKNREALYAHYEEFVENDLTKAVKAINQGDMTACVEVGKKLSQDVRFKDSELLYTVALSERMQKEYENPDFCGNIDLQRLPIPTMLQVMGNKLNGLSDKEKSLIPAPVWNRLGEVVINETLDSYYEKASDTDLADRNLERLNVSAIDLLPNVAKYGTFQDQELLNATIVVAHSQLSESDIACELPESCVKYFKERDYDCMLNISKGHIMEIKEDRRQQAIQKRVDKLRNRQINPNDVVEYKTTSGQSMESKKTPQGNSTDNKQISNADIVKAKLQTMLDVRIK